MAHRILPLLMMPMLLSACVSAVLPAPRGGFAAAAADASRFCVAHGPRFAGTGPAVLSAGGAAIERRPGRIGYRLASGNTLSLTTDRPYPQCVVYASARSYAEVTAAMAAQPGLVPVPGVAEEIALPGQPVVRFANSWRADSRGVAVRVGGVAGGMMTIVTEPLESAGLPRGGRGRGPTTAPPVIVR